MRVIPLHNAVLVRVNQTCAGVKEKCGADAHFCEVVAVGSALAQSVSLVIARIGNKPKPDDYRVVPNDNVLFSKYE